MANMSVMGYNLPKVYEGRGPLEAASIGVELQPGDMAMRCNIICIEDEKIKITPPDISLPKKLMCWLNIWKKNWVLTGFISIPVYNIAICW